MNQLSPTRRPKQSEEGYILLGVLILLAIFIIAMSVAAPRIASSIQRDRDLETMQRGKQYIRAIKLYYAKFHAYPPNLDALTKTNEIRFLRRRYLDPMTGKDDWKPIMFGQNKTPMAMGFFGQPLGGTGGAVLAGTGPQGGNGLGIPGSNMFGNNPGSDVPATGGLGSATDTSNGQNGQTGQAGQTGQSGSSTGTSGTFNTGPTFGGGGIIGVSPASPKKSILVYKKKDHYNEWEFLYSPLSDMQTMGGGNAGTIGQPMGAPGVNGPGLNGPGVNGPGLNGPGMNGPGAGAGMPNQPAPAPAPTPQPQQ